MKPIQPELFYHDGRGPELQRVHWVRHGTVLRAIDYYLPDAQGDDAHCQHVLFDGVQVVAITPEEVIDYNQNGEGLVKHKPAALFDLGRTAWLHSFAPSHLHQCHHYQAYFYDELFDVICESVKCLSGGYVGE